MPTVTTTIEIARPCATVFRFVTTPAYWPCWQPAVLAVHGVSDRPLLRGDQVTTDYLVAGRRGTVVWTVTARRAPMLLTLQGQIAGQANGGATAYRLTAVPNGVRFERTFTYDTQRPITRVQDAIDLQRRVQQEAELALAQLKRVLEEGSPCPPPGGSA